MGFLLAIVCAALAGRAVSEKRYGYATYFALMALGLFIRAAA